jgi:hypothetical protein
MIPSRPTPPQAHATRHRHWRAGHNHHPPTDREFRTSAPCTLHDGGPRHACSPVVHLTPGSRSSVYITQCALELSTPYHPSRGEIFIEHTSSTYAPHAHEHYSPHSHTTQCTLHRPMYACSTAAPARSARGWNPIVWHSPVVHHHRGTAHAPGVSTPCSTA